jgi:predicted amidohydrolase
LKVFDATVGRIGVAICYDSEFPLLVRAQAEAGADIVLIPSCTEFISGYNRVRTAALARALENTCVTIISSTVGDALWSPVVDRNVGAAGIFVPAERTVSETGILAEGSLNAKQWVYASFDLNPLRTIKRCGEMRNATDWTLQPGATPLADRIKIVPMQ